MEAPKTERLKEIVTQAFSITEDTAPNREIQNRLHSAGKVTGTNLCMMACANLIACIGLNAGSMTAVIGAMLIEPLMGSILLIAYSTVSASKEQFKGAILGFLFQITTSLIASTLYFLLTPVKEPTPELLSMTEPTLFDVMIAIIGGVAGVIGQTRKDKVNTIIPGVAIATALMPPLCTCGFGIANLNLKILLGAAYLFLVNSYFIALGASIVLSLFRIPKDEEMSEEEWQKARRTMIINTLIIVLPALLVSLYKLLV